MSMGVRPDDRGLRLDVRVAGSADAEAVAGLLDACHREFDEPTVGLAPLAARVRELLAGGDTAVLLGGAGPDGLAVLRFRAALWTTALESYLAELYVVPSLRRRGLGHALLEAAIEHACARGADYMELGTSEDNVAARTLYERLGFTNREDGADGPVLYFYERKLHARRPLTTGDAARRGRQRGKRHTSH
jgi:ribosomal protein S18 acetylase RimI-like enzyme